MRQKIEEVVIIPSGVECHVHGSSVNCKKGSVSLVKKFSMPGVIMEVKGDKLHFNCLKGNRKIRAAVFSAVAHIKNIFEGIENKFVYELEICNVHFPMTVKVEGNKLIVNNFLGEKEKRIANIVPGVHVEIKGQKITVSAHDIEAAGQTAANIEKATWVSKRDRRVFQDGIFITSKCGSSI